MENYTNEVNEIKTPSLASSAVLVSLSRSIPDLVKNDPEAARALARIKQANTKSLTAKKGLIISKPHDRLKEISRAMYRFHIANTLPWGNLGARLLTNAMSLDYQTQMELFLKELEQAKQEFLMDYPRAASAAQEDLGDLYDQSLYPSVHDLDCRIGVRLDYEPIADPDDFRVQVGNQAAEEMKQQFANVLKNRVESAYADVFKRLREPLVNMSERLNYVEEKDKTSFHNTLVSNVTQCVDLMRSCNITNNPEMTRITNELRCALDGVSAESLRNNVTQRLETKAKVDEIIKSIPAEPTLDF